MKQNKYQPVFRCDTLAFLLVALFFVYVNQNILSAFLVLCALSYMALDVAAAVPQPQIIRLVPRAQTAIIATAISTLVILPTVLLMVERARSTPVHFAQDSLIQVEAAARFILAGKNPYVENYLNTPLADWDFSWAGLDVNPALHHFAYMPLAFLLAVPGEMVRPLVHWYDHRLILLAAYLISLILATKITTTRHETNALCTVIGLNPLLIVAYTYGNLDALIIVGWLYACLFASQRRWTLAFLSLSLTIATKQIAGVAMPFLFIHWLATEHPRTLKDTLSPIVAFLIPLAIFVMPFLLWNPRAFIEDTVLFLIGGIPDSWPISGMSLQAMLPPSIATVIPAIGWPILITMLAVTGYLTWRLGSLQAALTFQTVFFSTAIFLGRFVNTQYVGYLLVQVAMALWIHPPKQPQPAYSSQLESLQAFQ